MLGRCNIKQNLKVPEWHLWRNLREIAFLAWRCRSKLRNSPYFLDVFSGNAASRPTMTRRRPTLLVPLPVRGFDLFLDFINVLSPGPTRVVFVEFDFVAFAAYEIIKSTWNRGHCICRRVIRTSEDVQDIKAVSQNLTLPSSATCKHVTVRSIDRRKIRGVFLAASGKLRDVSRLKLCNGAFEAPLSSMFPVLHEWIWSWTHRIWNILKYWMSDVYYDIY